MNLGASGTSASLYLSVLLPARNEREVISDTVRELERSLSNVSVPWEEVILDDHSEDVDDTFWAELMAAHPRLRVYRLDAHQGKDRAIHSGLHVVQGPLVLIMDSDLQHPPALIPRMLDVLRSKDLELVEAVKVDEKRPLLKRLFVQLYYFLLSPCGFRRFAGACDFKLLGPGPLAELKRIPPGSFFLRGACAMAHWRRSTVGFTVPPRPAGSSKWSFVALCRLAVRTMLCTHFPRLFGRCCGQGVGPAAGHFVEGRVIERH